MSTTSRVLPGLGLTGGWSAGENGWADGVNANWLAISVYTQARALDIVDTLPTSPTQGDVYLLSETTTTNAGAVAAYDNSAWSYFTPQTGFEFYVASKSAVYRYDGTTWAAASSGGGDYTLPAATATSLGGIKVGGGLTVGKDGTLATSDADAEYIESTAAEGETAVTNIVTNADGRAEVFNGTTGTVLASLSDLLLSDPSLKAQLFTTTVTFNGSVVTIPFPIAFKAGTVPKVFLPSYQEVNGGLWYSVIGICGNTNEHTVVYKIGWGGGSNFAGNTGTVSIDILAIGERQ